MKVRLNFATAFKHGKILTVKQLEHINAIAILCKGIFIEWVLCNLWSMGVCMWNLDWNYINQILQYFSLVIIYVGRLYRHVCANTGFETHHLHQKWLFQQLVLLMCSFAESCSLCRWKCEIILAYLLKGCNFDDMHSSETNSITFESDVWPHSTVLTHHTNVLKHSLGSPRSWFLKMQDSVVCWKFSLF